MKRHLAFAALATLLGGLAHAEERKAITIASEGASPPWDYIDGNGALVGFDIDVGNELCARMKLLMRGFRAAIVHRAGERQVAGLVAVAWISRLNKGGFRRMPLSAYEVAADRRTEPKLLTSKTHRPLLYVRLCASKVV